MWGKTKDHKSIIQSKPAQKKCPGLKKYFEPHFNPDHTKLRIPSEIGHTPVYTQVLQSLFSNVNYNESSDEDVKKAKE